MKSTRPAEVQQPQASFRCSGPLPPESTMLVELLKSCEIQSLLESYYNLINVPIAIIDLHANVLFSSPRQRICTQFHRVHPTTCTRCLENDRRLTSGLQEGESCAIGGCPNGLTECAVSLIIEGKHVANICLGQFLTQPPDEAVFLQQAIDCGFDQADYLAALREVPVIHAEKVPVIMDVLARMTRSITTLSMARKRTVDNQAGQTVILNTIPQSVFWKDTHGRFLGCNAPFAKAAGLASPGEIVGKTDFDLWPRPDAEAYRADDFAVLSSNKARLHIQETLKQADGSRITIDTSKVPIADPGGTVCGIVGIYDDITERQRAEELLRASEEQYRSLFANMAAGLMVAEVLFDAEGRPCDHRFVQANPAFEKLIGVQASELVGKTGTEAVIQWPPEIRERLYRVAMTGEPIQYERFNESLHRYFETRVFSPRRGQFAHVFTDITERKRADEERTRLAASMEQAAEAVMITDVVGTILYVNPAFEKITGYTRQEAISQNPRILKSGKQTPEFYHQMWQKLTAGEVWHGRFINKMKDGTLYEEETTISPIRDAGGNVVNYVALKLDVTREVYMEMQLRQSQKMEALGTLASGVAHEINNPINGVLNYAQVIADSLSPDSDLHKYLGRIMKETIRVAQIARNLLAFARQDKQERGLTKMNDVVHAVLTLVQTLIRHDQITLRVDIPDELPPMECRGQQIQQVVMNLVMNARDALNEKYPSYHDDKIIRITAECLEKDGQIWLRTTVEDHASGIPEHARNRVFDPFFTTKTAGKGTGLGLSISYGIVRDHGGVLHFETETGQGTRFHMDLPVRT